jgi:hypothetical protein
VNLKTQTRAAWVGGAALGFWAGWFVNSKQWIPLTVLIGIWIAIRLGVWIGKGTRPRATQTVTGSTVGGNVTQIQGRRHR